MRILRARAAAPAVLAVAALFALDFRGTDAFLLSPGLGGAVGGWRVVQGGALQRVAGSGSFAPAERAPLQRAVLRMSADAGGGGTSPEEQASAGGGKKEDKVALRQGDVEVLLSMANAEEADGNSTGAAAYRDIAERFTNIMSRSTARMSSSLSLKPEPGSEMEADVVWPYVDPGLTADGSNVWRTTSGTISETTTSGAYPATARLLESYSGEEGASVTWTVRINELNGLVCIGLTTIMVDLDKPWNEVGSLNSAFYITQNGNMYNGDQLVCSANVKLKSGDIVGVALEDDGVFFSINGNELPQSIKPVSGTVRLSVQLTATGDGVALVDTTVRREARVVEEEDTGAFSGGGYSGGSSRSRTVTLSREEIDDDESAPLLAGLLDDSLAGVAGVAGVGSTGVAAVGRGFGGAKEKRKRAWEMAIDEKTNQVYYWNRETKETVWDRPSDYVSGTAEITSFAVNEAEDAGKLLEQVGDKGSLQQDNIDGELDSFTTVAFDAEGYPELDRFVYVDEETCIGCTNCATVARQTFMMEPLYGRARSFRQGGDSDETVQEAVSTCPVDCIWYVSWDDLITLESERKFQMINPTARLVGGSFVESTGTAAYYGRNRGDAGGGPSKASIMQSNVMRCNNCPGKGCADCPLFGVGKNPEYERKKAAKKRSRAEKKEMSIDGAGFSEDTGSSFTTDTEESTRS